EQGRRARLRRPESEDLGRERVARLRGSEVDRSTKRVQTVEVERAEARCRVALLELAGRHLLGVEVHHVTRVDLDRGLGRVVPLEVELVATDPMLAHAGVGAHLRTA